MHWQLSDKRLKEAIVFVLSIKYTFFVKSDGIFGIDYVYTQSQSTNIHPAGPNTTKTAQSNSYCLKHAVQSR